MELTPTSTASTNGSLSLDPFLTELVTDPMATSNKTEEKMEGKQVEIELVKKFLKEADVISMMGNIKKDNKLKSAFFNSLKSFDDHPDIITRAFELLQDCQIIMENGISNEELKLHFPSIILCLKKYVSNDEVIFKLLEFLALVSDRDVVKQNCCKEDDEVFEMIEQALTIHHKRNELQMAGLQFLEGIITKGDNQLLKAFAGKCFKFALDNLVLHTTNPGLSFTCISILIKVCDIVDTNLITIWTEQLVESTLQIMLTLSSDELVAKCLHFLQKIPLDDQISIILNHDRGILSFCDAIKILDSKTVSSAIIAMNFINDIADDERFKSIPLEALQPMIQSCETALDESLSHFLAVLHEENKIRDPNVFHYLTDLHTEIALRFRAALDITDMKRSSEKIVPKILSPKATALASPKALPSPNATAMTMSTWNIQVDHQINLEQLTSFDNETDVVILRNQIKKLSNQIQEFYKISSMERHDHVEEKKLFTRQIKDLTCELEKSQRITQQCQIERDELKEHTASILKSSAKKSSEIGKLKNKVKELTSECEEKKKELEMLKAEIKDWNIASVL